MSRQKSKVRSSKSAQNQKPNMPEWLERDTPYVRHALETASRHFDKNDVMDVHTLEGLYAQESSFGTIRGKRNSDGAVGDFQIKRKEAQKLGLQVTKENDERFDMDTASAAAAKKLKTSDNLFRKESKIVDDLKTTAIKDAEERKKFVIAAYNAGDARIAEAQRLALAAGEDPTKWGNVQKYLEKAGATADQAKEIRGHVANVSNYEKQFAKKSAANADAKYKKGKAVDPYPNGGHWITKDGRHILIKD